VLPQSQAVKASFGVKRFQSFAVSNFEALIKPHSPIETIPHEHRLNIREPSISLKNPVFRRAREA
jgi:hypothetical protein